MPTTKSRAPETSPEDAKTAAAQGVSQLGAPFLDVESLTQGKKLASDSVPMMAPPGEEIEAAFANAGSTAWHNDKTVTAMWCNSSNRNAFAAISGLGWRKISNANDSAFLSMTMMASHAEATGARVNVNIDTGNEIIEIYVWS